MGRSGAAASNGGRPRQHVCDGVSIAPPTSPFTPGRGRPAQHPTSVCVSSCRLCLCDISIPPLSPGSPAQHSTSVCFLFSKVSAFAGCASVMSARQGCTHRKQDHSMSPMPRAFVTSCSKMYPPRTKLKTVSSSPLWARDSGPLGLRAQCETKGSRPECRVTYATLRASFARAASPFSPAGLWPRGTAAPFRSCVLGGPRSRPRLTTLRHSQQTQPLNIFLSTKFAAFVCPAVLGGVIWLAAELCGAGKNQRLFPDFG